MGEKIAIEKLYPRFPVAHCVLLRSGLPWNRTTKLSKDYYDDLESLANDLERIDTRNIQGTWLEDANGRLWDIKVDILFDTIDSTEFYLRPEPS